MTFEEWWTARHRDSWGNPHGAAEAAWHARDEEVKALADQLQAARKVSSALLSIKEAHEGQLITENLRLQARITELEGIDQACDAANQHVLLLEKDVEKLQARIGLVIAIAKKQMEEFHYVSSQHFRNRYAEGIANVRRVIAEEVLAALDETKGDRK